MTAAAHPFGPPPSVPFEVSPTPEEVAFFREHGYLAVDRITTDEEIDWLAAVYDYVFDPDRVPDVIRPVDRSGTRDPGAAGTIMQSFHPEVVVGEILQTTYVRNAKRYTAALTGLEESELSVWTHMIRKAPGAREVPPHQDEAFWPPELEYRSVAAWLPMHDVTVEMGAMQFLPGSHLDGVLHHRSYDDPKQRLLTVDPPIAPDAFVACPLRKGGCTFHHPTTVHRTEANRTDRPRLAFPLTVQSPPIRRPAPRPTPWLDEYLAAGGQRQTAYIADAKVVPLPA